MQKHLESCSLYQEQLYDSESGTDSVILGDDQVEGKDNVMLVSGTCNKPNSKGLLHYACECNRLQDGSNNFMATHSYIYR